MLLASTLNPNSVSIVSVHAGNSTFSFTALNKLKKKCQPADINLTCMDLILFCGPISNDLFSIGVVIIISKSMQTISYMSHVCAFLYVSADPVASRANVCEARQKTQWF